MCGGRFLLGVLVVVVAEMKSAEVNFIVATLWGAEMRLEFGLEVV
jgi:hypothetical protein